MTGYGVYRGGSRVATATAATWIFSGLTCNTSYTLAVDAVDAAGNRSQQAVVMVSTTACADTQAPTAPTGLKASNVSQTGATLRGLLHGQRRRDRLRRAQQRHEGRVGDDTVLASVRARVRDAVHVRGRRVRRSGQPLLGGAARYVHRGLPHGAASTTDAVDRCRRAVGHRRRVDRRAEDRGSARRSSHRPARSGGTATITGDVDISRSSVTLDHLTVNGVVTFTSGASASKFTSGASYGFDVNGADNVTVEGNTFDGRCQRAQNWVIEEPAGQVPNGTTIRNNTFRNYYMCSDSSAHTEALFIAYSDGGVIEGNTFEDNGTTAHVFFSYVGANGSLDTSDYARNWCVRGNTFRRAINPWYSINFRQEIPASANTSVDPTSNTTDRILIGPTTTEAAEHTKSC